MPYGGIVRPVSLLVTRSVYLKNFKVESKPDLAGHTAVVTIRAIVRTLGKRMPRSASPVRLPGLAVHLAPLKVVHQGETEFTWTGTLHEPRLWSPRDPFLYDATLGVGEEMLSGKFGVREVRVQGTVLLLNGRPVHLFGANRVSEDPAEGLRESDAIVNRDMSDMLADNMRMMRIAHYPQAPALLDYADSHGMLLIAEAGNWNLGAWQMADPEVRRVWQAQMKEMMQQDWNHPSVIAWSVGNEFESATPQGIAWVRDMRAYTLGIDSTRLITFASRFTGYPEVKNR